jgi:hypothetical protein
VPPQHALASTVPSLRPRGSARYRRRTGIGRCRFTQLIASSSLRSRRRSASTIGANTSNRRLFSRVGARYRRPLAREFHRRLIVVHSFPRRHCDRKEPPPPPPPPLLMLLPLLPLHPALRLEEIGKAPDSGRSRAVVESCASIALPLLLDVERPATRGGGFSIHRIEGHNTTSAVRGTVRARNDFSL